MSSPFVQIKDFYKPTIDGDDWWPAIVRAINNYSPGTPLYIKDTDNADFYSYRGLTIYFEPIEYYFSKTIPLLRGVSLVGSGGTGYYSGTTFAFPADTIGLSVENLQTSPLYITSVNLPPTDPNYDPELELKPGNGAWSIIERIRFQGKIGVEQNIQDVNYAPIAHGIVAKAPIMIRDCYITNFNGDGIHLRGYNLGAGKEQSNSDTWQIHNVQVGGCRGNGLRTTGGDASAGKAAGLNCIDNWLWGVKDESFYGNTFVGCHTRSNGTRINLNQDLLPGSDVIDELVKGGAYYCKREGEGNTSKSTFIYCYAEGDQPNIRLTPNSSNYNWTPLPNTEIHGPGTVVIGGEIVMDLDKVRALPPAYLQSDGYSTFPFGVRGLSSNGLVEGLLGGEGDYTAFQFLLSNETVTDFTHYQLSYNDSTWNGWWQIHPKAFPADPSIQLSTGLSDSVLPGEVWLRKGYYIGDDSNRLKINTADGKPDERTGKLGDQVWNRNPTLGSHIGWVCTQEAGPGQPAKWYPFGKIEI